MEVVGGTTENGAVSSVEMVSSLIRQLKEAYMKLEAHKIVSEDELRWEDIESHFRQMEAELKKKEEDLKVKEEEFAKKIAERKAVVSTKEQEFLDRAQELKDAAVDAIFEARAKHKAESAEPANVSVTGGDDNKVSSSLDVENAPLPIREEGDGVDDKGKRYADLIRSCELMDANGLLNFITHNRKDLSAVCSELTVALSSATQPARLVLDLLEGFFPSANNTKQGVSVNDAHKGLRQSCWVVVEALAAMLAKADPAVDSFLNQEIKGQAKAIADEWKPKLAVEGNDAANGNANSLEIEGFLRLLATFRIGSEFDQDELCKLVLAVAYRHRQATELCLSLGLTEKMPGIIEVLINNGKLSDAVHLIQAFQLSDTYPPVPLLKEYLRTVRRNTQGKGARGNTNPQGYNNKQELTACEAVVKCIKDYKLEADYPLLPLEVRIAQLMRSKDPKRIRVEKKYNQADESPKKARINGGYRGNHTHTFNNRTGNITVTRQAQVPYLTERASAYVETPERHPHATATTYSYQAASQSAYAAPDTQGRYAHAAATTYNYPAASQPAYAAPLAGDQKSYYYMLDDATTSAGYGSAAPGYLSHTGSGAPGYASHAVSRTPGYATHPASGVPGYESHAVSGAPGYATHAASGVPGYTSHAASGAPGYATYTGSGAPGYATHTGSGVHPSHPHQPYM